MDDQRTMWNDKHATNGGSEYTEVINDFAKQVGAQLASGQRLLELGCGGGCDAEYFASLGVQVTATDFSDIAIAQNQARVSSGNPVFAVLDISQTLPYDSASFDAVYAHWSLHYYNQDDTAKIFAEIARVLKPGGMLYFACKSDKDPLYGKGDEIQPGVFQLDGHIRHFFSMEYTKRLVAEHFEIVKAEDVTGGDYWDMPSAFIRCWAKKK